MAEELKPCPFCGDRDDYNPSLTQIQRYAEPGDSETGKVANLAAGLVDAGWLVECDKCGGNGPPADTEAEAITAWNKRPAPTDAQVEAAARAIADRRGSNIVQHFHRADARAALEAVIRV